MLQDRPRPEDHGSDLPREGPGRDVLCPGRAPCVLLHTHAHGAHAAHRVRGTLVSPRLGPGLGRKAASLRGSAPQLVLAAQPSALGDPQPRSMRTLQCPLQEEPRAASKQAWAFRATRATCPAAVPRSTGESGQSWLSLGDSPRTVTSYLAPASSRKSWYLRRGWLWVN